MLRIYGAGDDLVEVEGAHTDEIGCYDKAVTVTAKSPEMGHGLAVTMRYASTPNSCGWAAEVMQLDGNWEPAPIPWPVTVRTANEREDYPEYSVIVEIDCPDDVAVTTETF